MGIWSGFKRWIGVADAVAGEKLKDSANNMLMENPDLMLRMGKDEVKQHLAGAIASLNEIKSSVRAKEEQLSNHEKERDNYLEVVDRKKTLNPVLAEKAMKQAEALQLKIDSETKALGILKMSESKANGVVEQLRNRASQFTEAAEQVVAEHQAAQTIQQATEASAKMDDMLSAGNSTADSALGAMRKHTAQLQAQAEAAETMMSVDAQLSGDSALQEALKEVKTESTGTLEERLERLKKK